MQDSTALPILLIMTIAGYILQSWYAQAKKSAAPEAPSEDDQQKAA